MKRSITVLLTALLFFAFLTGCGQTPSNTDTGVTTTAAATAATTAAAAAETTAAAGAETATTAAAAAETTTAAPAQTTVATTAASPASQASSLKEGDFTGYPIVSADKLVIWNSCLPLHNSYTSDSESPYMQFLSEYTGIEIDWLRPPTGAEEEQAYNLMIASGDLPDIIMRYGLAGVCETLLEDGIIIALNDYMDDYLPSINAYLNNNEIIKKAIMTDSSQFYMVPGIREDTEFLGSWLGPVVNKAYLEDVNLDLPETIDDWNNMLYAFKDTIDIPFSPYISGHLRGLFGNSFGFYDGFYVDLDNKAAHWMNAEGYKDFLILMNRWFMDGIIDPNFVTMDIQGLAAQLVEKKIGASYYGTATPNRFYDAIVERDGDFNYVGVPYPVAKAGDKVLFKQGELLTGIGAAITTACKNVELAARFLDYGYSEEGLIVWNFGKEGVSFDYVGGKPVFKDFILNDPEGTTTAMQKYSGTSVDGISLQLTDMILQRDRELSNGYRAVWGTNAEESARYRWPATITPTVDEGTELANIQTALLTYADEMYIKFIIGSEPLDNYDQYLANLESMNIGRVLDIKNDQLTRYNAR